MLGPEVEPLADIALLAELRAKFLHIVTDARSYGPYSKRGQQLADWAMDAVAPLIAENERLREALVWEVKMGHTTAVPPVSVQHAMNEIRVAVGETPWPVRMPTSELDR